MTGPDLTEKRFEQDIETFLCTQGGYLKGDPRSFDRSLALDTKTFLSFIQKSQGKLWERYTSVYGAESEKSIVKRFCDEVRQVGLLKVLRAGLSDRGMKFRFVFWKGETAINAATAALYESNVLHCTRQLHYSPANENSIDITLFLNGIPVVSLELKNQFTGQDADKAIQQYRFDRSGRDPIFEFKNRVLVHFAVDLYNVYMTTRLNGEATEFLPFNRGSNGAGNLGGRGNPHNPNGYVTSYLWEQVLVKDRLLEILHKYLHLQDEIMIFPRYHQLDVVTKLLAHVKENGSGTNYLIQHSAGSGKSNSIAWLAHRLSGLHDNGDTKIFQSVIVVTDRKVLDSQLQDTIYQFDHVQGVVVKIDKDSAQLRDAINNGAGVIITTLQKFPIIYKEVNGANKNFAIIVDEAHASQSGEAAQKLKKALADTEAILAEYARMENEEEAARPGEDDKLLDELSSQGQHKNLSFFAFTATPKEKTLQMFGVKGGDGKYRAFHIYSMRQAIEEGFILDVLRHYMTWTMYYKIAKDIPDNPEMDTEAGIRAVRRYESLHPHNIAQKTDIMLRHFRDITRHKIGGKAKAMVVTASRLHAVRYLLEFRRQIEANNYTGLDVLVAFSGAVNDDGAKYTEEGLNKTRKGETIKDKQLRNYFHTGEFNMLIVAEKYQTGFDEPYLHTMFVDKQLSGVKAVQTLSRLNRTMKGKEDTFILDFVNTADEIQRSFEPYYEAAFLEEETSPNVVYALKNTLDTYRIYLQPEIDRFADLYYSGGAQSAAALGALSGIFRPAIDRYVAKPVEEKDQFSAALSRFIRIYSFITQVCRLFDKDMHRFNIYAKFLLKFLPTKDVERAEVDDKIIMEYYRLRKSFDGSIALTGSETGFAPISGQAGAKKQKKDTLQVIIDKVNEKFGTRFTEEDRLILEQLVAAFVSKEKYHYYAQNNDRAVFKILFNKDFMDIAAGRYEKNDAFFVRLFEDSAFMQLIAGELSDAIFNKLRRSAEKAAEQDMAADVAPPPYQ